jgi:O-methyltransferase
LSVTHTNQGRDASVSRRLMSRARRSVLGLRDFVVPRYHVLSVAQQNSLADRRRLECLMRLSESLAERNLGGDVVECGVFRGGSAIVLADPLFRTSSEALVWLYDVFTGMPEPGPEDPPGAKGYVGLYVSSESVVRNTFACARIPDHRVRIVSGRLEDTLRSAAPTRPIQLLHLDCDWYESVSVCLEALYHQVLPGGMIIFDDYGHWLGCRKAVDEFFAKRSISVKLIPIDYTSHFMIKPNA